MKRTARTASLTRNQTTAPLRETRDPSRPEGRDTPLDRPWHNPLRYIKPSGDPNLTMILQHCVSIYGKAAGFYRDLAPAAESVQISQCWAELSANLLRIREGWERVLRAGEEGTLAVKIENPHELGISLHEIDSELDVLLGHKESARNVRDAFYLAYVLECCLLSPAIGKLLHSIQDLPLRSVSETTYDNHLLTFVREFGNYTGSDVFSRALVRSLRHLRDHTRAILDRSKIDDASGVYSRKGLRNAIVPLANLAQRNRYTVGIMMISVDNIYTLYDTLGSLQGDKTVRALAAAIKRLVRRSDIVGRYDQGVFHVYFSQVKHPFLEHVARQVLAAVKPVLPQDLRLDFSIGCSYGRLERSMEVQLEELFRKAEDCLQRARLSTTHKILVE